MTRYNSVFELAAELDAKGFIRDRDVTIPADGDPEESCLSADDGTLYCYPKYKVYYIHLK